MIFGLIATLFLLSCKPTPTPVTPDPPTVSINSIALFEGDATTTFTFKVSLSRATDQTVTVDFATADGTAAAGSDYVAKSGTVTIKPQNTEGSIEITVIGDTIKEADETFNVVLSKAVNATLINGTVGTGTIRNDDTYVFIPTDGYTTPESYTGYEKVWQDEFSGTNIDATSWGYDTGGSGWGNNELQYYTNRPENAYLNNGMLVIQAKKEAYTNRDYTSARLLTKGKREFTFGRIDIRAKLPVSKGLWPALWMLGKKIDQTNWPACGEIDIMELIGKEIGRASCRERV